MSKEEDISVDYLRTRLRYEPEAGKLFWLDAEDMPNNWRAKHLGKEAFTADNGDGYRKGRILNKPFFAHRVIWALHYGEWPKGEIDHINGLRDDNRIENLRVVSGQENCKNQRIPSNNTSGVIGVYWYRQRNKWAAKIMVKDKDIHLGLFICMGQAIKARREAEKFYGFHPNHGKR